MRGFNVMKEYFHDPEATRAAIDGDGWLRTGDIGYVDAEGNIRITDRKKDMYIAGGSTSTRPRSNASSSNIRPWPSRGGRGTRRPLG